MRRRDSTCMARLACPAWCTPPSARHPKYDKYATIAIIETRCPRLSDAIKRDIFVIFFTIISLIINNIRKKLFFLKNETFLYWHPAHEAYFSLMIVVGEIDQWQIFQLLNILSFTLIPLQYRAQRCLCNHFRSFYLKPEIQCKKNGNKRLFFLSLAKFF